MKIVIDNNIPFIKGVLEPCAERVEYLHESLITPEAVRDADALLIRTHTRCNAQLLDGSKVKFIATGTIGMDHIDIPYCRSRGITVANAPGCNAPAVAQYVMAAIDRLLDGAPVAGLTLGIVGVGNVGSIVERWARSMGMRVLRCDPPRARREGSEGFTDLLSLARESDIVTFHTPLTRSGEDASWHLADEQFFAHLKPGAHIINASRGGVVDEAAMLASPNVGSIAIDTWEGEPAVNLDTLHQATIATPHIAGYSLEGKTRATRMILEAFAQAHPELNVQSPLFSCEFATPQAMTMEAIRRSYDIMADDTLLRNSPSHLTDIRNNYTLRNETLTI